MADLQSQLLQLIESQLPEQTAGVLRSYLKDTQNIKQELEASREALKGLQTRHTNLEQDFAKVKKELEHYREVDKNLYDREVEVSKRENNAEVNKLNIQLECEKRISNNIYALVEKVFRNPELVKRGQGNVPIIHAASGSCASWTEQRQVDTKTTETIE